MLKTVSSIFLHELCPETGLLCWSGCLEYQGRRKLFGGAKIGLDPVELVRLALGDLFSHLKEPVAVQLTSFPSFGQALVALLGESFSGSVISCCDQGEVPDSLSSLFAEVKAFSDGVLENKESVDVAGAFFAGFGCQDE